MEIHRLVFENNVQGLREFLLNKSNKNSHLNGIDLLWRGQTALTLAISLSHVECVDILLKNGASTLIRNHGNWSPYQEATSIGNRDLMEMLIRQRNDQVSRWFELRGKQILHDLSNVSYWLTVAHHRLFLIFTLK